MNQQPSVECPTPEEIEAVVREVQVPKRLKKAKLTGAVTTQVVREHLIATGIPISPRDVFIARLPAEIDLLVIRPDAKPLHDIVFPPEDVLAVLEVKYSGLYSREGVPRLKEQFDEITRTHPHIRCMYLTIMENPKYRYGARKESLGYEVFTLHTTNSSRSEIRPTGEWENALLFLKKVAGTAAS